MIESKTCEYDTAIRCAVRIFPGLASVPNAIRQTAEEIRIRSGYPIIIRTGMQNHITQITPDSEMLAECISAICQNSLHTYEKDIANGFITLYGGHRAGLCGTAVYSNGGLQTVKNFSSINIRIARQHYGAARDLLPLFESECRSRGLLIVGRALSGKTTILRDLCRCIGGMFRVSLIDERQEIAAVYNGKPCLDVGLMTDVFSGYGKSDGIIRAVRCMSPDYIVTDELGADAKSIRQADIIRTWQDYRQKQYRRRNGCTRTCGTASFLSAENRRGGKKTQGQIVHNAWDNARCGGRNNADIESGGVV